jgi:hypothetical protein
VVASASSVTSAFSIRPPTRINTVQLDESGSDFPFIAAPSAERMTGWRNDNCI